MIDAMPLILPTHPWNRAEMYSLICMELDISARWGIGACEDNITQRACPAIRGLGILAKRTLAILSSQGVFRAPYLVSSYTLELHRPLSRGYAGSTRSPFQVCLCRLHNE